MNFCFENNILTKKNFMIFLSEFPNKLFSKKNFEKNVILKKNFIAFQDVFFENMSTFFGYKNVDSHLISIFFQKIFLRKVQTYCEIITHIRIFENFHINWSEVKSYFCLWVRIQAKPYFIYFCIESRKNFKSHYKLYLFLQWIRHGGFLRKNIGINLYFVFFFRLSVYFC
jgi:hypothetical protein